MPCLKDLTGISMPSYATMRLHIQAVAFQGMWTTACTVVIQGECTGVANPPLVRRHCHCTFLRQGLFIVTATECQYLLAAAPVLVLFHVHACLANRLVVLHCVIPLWLTP